MSRVVLVAPDSRLERNVRLLVADDMEVIPSPDPVSFPSRLARLSPRPELVVFGSHLPRDLALGLAVSARQFTDAMAIVTDDADIMVHAMRAGISEVLPVDVDLDAMDLVLAKAHEFSMDAAAAGRTIGQARTKPGRIIAVASPKGGVGKTTIACNVALGLARYAPGSVVIVDLDLQFGDVAATLNVEPTYFLEHAVSRASSRDALVLRTVLTAHPAHVAVVAAPASPAGADHITTAQVAHLLRQLATEFRYVVVDTSPGISEHTLGVLEQATDLVAITSMDISSVRGLRTELDVLAELELLPASRQVVVNLADRWSGLSVADIETAIGQRVDVVLPRARAVAIATNRGNPVLVDSPRDKSSRSLRLLVARLESAAITRRGWRDASRKEKVS